ncbi:MAG: hypothetical protein ACYCPS_00055 [Candidatus Saccharimonadales bacterium]
MSIGVGISEAPQNDLLNEQAQQLLRQAIDVERFEALSVHDVSLQKLVDVERFEALSVHDVSLQKLVDVDRFVAIPEHDGNLQKLIERYGDNPGSCPFINSMGKAGVQLVQQLAEAEKNPNRGPTIRELIEGRKNETQEQTTHRVVSPTRDPATALAVASASKTSEPRVKSLSEVQSKHVILEAEHIVQQHLFELAKRQRDDIEQVHKPVIPSSETNADQATRKVPSIKSLPSIVITPEPKTPADSFRAPAEASYVHRVLEEDTSSTLETRGGSPDIAIGIEVEGIIEPVVDTDEHSYKFGLHYTATEISDYIEDALAGVEVVASQANIAEDEPFNEPIIDQIGVATASNETVDNIENHKEEDLPALTEVAQPIELLAELNAYIKTIDAKNSELTDAAVKILVQVLEASRTAIEKNEEISEINVKMIDRLFRELLEPLKLVYQEEAVKKLINVLLSPETITEIAEDHELSLDQLNYLGTKEYDSLSLSSLLTSLVRMIKQIVAYHLKLGKYAVSASMA